MQAAFSQLSRQPKAGADISKPESLSRTALLQSVANLRIPCMIAAPISSDERFFGINPLLNLPKVIPHYIDCGHEILSFRILDRTIPDDC